MKKIYSVIVFKRMARLISTKRQLPDMYELLCRSQDIESR